MGKVVWCFKKTYKPCTISTVNLVFIGKPASGKGTQSVFISDQLGIPRYSMGQLLRDYAKEDTDTARSIQQLLDTGTLVPSALTISLIKETVLQKDGWLLDGFPRKMSQVEGFEKVLKETDKTLNIAIELYIPDDLVMERLTLRRMCSQNSEHIYNLKFKPPQQENLCDICGAELVQRSDDTLLNVTERLRVFHDETQPVIDHYRKTGQLVTVSGEGAIEDVTKALISALRPITRS